MGQVEDGLVMAFALVGFALVVRPGDGGKTPVPTAAGLNQDHPGPPTRQRASPSPVGPMNPPPRARTSAPAKPCSATWTSNSQLGV